MFTAIDALATQQKNHTLDIHHGNLSPFDPSASLVARIDVVILER